MKEKLELLIGELQNTQSREAIFNEIYVILSSQSPQNVSEMFKTMGVSANELISSLLSYMRGNNEDIIRIIQKILQSLSPSDLITLDNTLILGLNHSSADIQEIFLKELRRSAEDNKALFSFLQNGPLLHVVAKHLSDENTSVAKHSASLLVLLFNQPQFHHLLLSSLKNVFDELMNGTEVVKFRLYQLIVSIASSSPSSLQAVAHDYLERLILESRKSEDILVQLNSIELLSELAVVEHGLLFIEQKGILQQFKQSLLESPSNPLASFLVPGLLRFFGNIGITNPEKIVTVLPLLLSILRTSNSSLQGVAIETVGAVGTPNTGKLLLNMHDSEMEECMKIIGAVIMSGEAEQRVRAIETVVRLVNHQESSATNEVKILIEKWYKFLTNEPTSMFFALCKQPFQEMKVGALDILGKISSTEWGQREIVSLPGFLEYILDRGTEHEKEGKERKYIVIREIVESPTATLIFSADILLKLKKYAQEGPFFVQVETAVDFERCE